MASEKSSLLALQLKALSPDELKNIVDELARTAPETTRTLAIMFSEKKSYVNVVNIPPATHPYVTPPYMPFGPCWTIDGAQPGLVDQTTGTSYLVSVP